MKKFFQNEWLKALLITSLIVGLFGTEMAMAGSDGSEFNDIWTLLSGWAKGTLGKIIALGIFMVGIAAGIVNQSIVATVAGIGGALVMYYGPAVIEGIVTAVI